MTAKSGMIDRPGGWATRLAHEIATVWIVVALLLLPLIGQRAHASSPDLAGALCLHDGGAAPVSDLAGPIGTAPGDAAHCRIDCGLCGVAPALEPPRLALAPLPFARTSAAPSLRHADEPPRSPVTLPPSQGPPAFG